MIKFVDVCKRYANNVQAVDNATFTIEQGEFVFLTGASGAGKSTIIKLLLKEVEPDSGDIYFQGDKISRVSNRMVPKIRSEVGVVFQDFRLLQNRTVYENIEFVLDILGLSKAEKRKRIDEVLDMVALKDRKKAYPNQLSGGEQQRVSIARAISTKPKVLIADEPTGNLDPVTSWEVTKFIEEINKTGTTVIMSTHSKEIVDRMNKRVISMSKGQIVRDCQGGYNYEVD